jgi:hypothetical protein
MGSTLRTSPYLWLRWKAVLRWTTLNHSKLFSNKNNKEQFSTVFKSNFAKSKTVSNSHLMVRHLAGMSGNQSVKFRLKSLCQA